MLFFGVSTDAQEIDVNNYKMNFSFTTTKIYDNSRLLEIKFIAKNKKNRKDKIPIYDAEVKFINVLNDTEALIGISKTSQEGIATITVPDDHDYLLDEAGNINLIARFEGSNAIKKKEAEIIIKNLHLELNLEEVDSVKTILVNAFTRDNFGVKTPVIEAEIILSIEAMFSKMIIEEGILKDGKFEFEFPADIPGDVNGDIVVYAIIEDNDEFGNVIQKETINWGTFNKITKKDKYALWASLAPIWMYVVLTIMLVGVWANYIYTIINLFKIKKDGVDLEYRSD
jgi:hypothetical protein